MSIPNHSAIAPEHCATCEIYYLEKRIRELKAAASVPDVRFISAQTIGAGSWLQDERFTWFRKAHGYASAKTNAISGLAAIHPEDLYYVFIFMVRDMGFEVVDGKLVSLELTK